MKPIKAVLKTVSILVPRLPAAVYGDKTDKTPGSVIQNPEKQPGMPGFAEEGTGETAHMNCWLPDIRIDSA